MLFFLKRRSTWLVVGGLVIGAVLTALFLRPLRPAISRKEAGIIPGVRSQLGLEPVLQAEAALRSTPGDPRARERLAQACVQAGDPAGAALALYPLLDGVPSPENVSRFASQCIAVGWLDEAAAALKRPGAHPIRTRLRLADAYANHGMGGRAAAVLASLPPEQLQPDDWLQGAVIWLRCRQPEKAVEWARRGAAQQAENPAAALLLVRCLAAEGQPEAALKVLRPLRVRSGAAPKVAHLMEFWQGRVELRHPGAALRKSGMERLARVARSDPNNAVAAFEAGRAYLRAGDAPAAVPLLTRALGAGYQQILCYDLLAQAYALLGRKREEAWAQGKAEVLRGELKEAQASFRRSLELEPSKPAAYLELARTLSSDGKVEEALAVLRRAQKITPTDMDVALLKAAVLGRLERILEQIRELEAAAALDPRRANEPLGELGKLYYNSQQFDRAIPVLQRALWLEDGDAYSHLYLGLTYARRTEDPVQAEKAVYHLLRAGQAAPDYFYPWMNAGAMLQRLGHLPEAAACYQRAIDGDSRWEGPYLSLSQVLQRQGRLPERKLALKLYARARESEARRQQLDSAANARPGDAKARFALGEQLLRDGRHQEALSELLLSTSLKPRWKEAQARLADVCALLDYDDLRREAERAAR
jgi:tetratricopeptide (TPR) repeat protein